MQSVERGETEAGPGGAFSSGAGACPSRGGKSPPRGKMEARRARRFQGRWLSSFLFSLSQAAPSVSCTVVLGTDAVLPGRGAIFQYPPTHLGMWYWLRTSAAGGKLAAEAMREIKDAIR